MSKIELRFFLRMTYKKFSTFLNPEKIENFRENRIVFSAISNIVSKGFNLIFVLITTPLLFNYLESESFGLLMTILSFLSILSFSDFGLGQGLQNNIPKYEAQDDKLKINELISTTFYFLLFISVFLFFLFFLFFNNINWGSLLLIKNNATSYEINSSISIFFICFFLILPVNIIQRINYAYQKGFINDFFEIISNLITLLLVVLAVKFEFKASNILLLILLTKFFMLTINLVLHFKIKKLSFPRLRNFRYEIFLETFRNGLLYLLLQINLFFFLSIDPIVISRFKGVSYLPIFIIGYRLYSIFMVPVQSYLGNTLPAINHAFEMNDTKWVKYFISKTIKWVLFISSLLAIIFIISANFIIGNWINKSTALSINLIIGFGVYILFSNLNALILSCFMTSKLIIYCVIMYSIATIVSVLLKIYLINYFSIEILLWVNAFSFLLFILIPSIYIFNKRILSTPKFNTTILKH